MSTYRTVVDWIESHRDVGLDVVRIYLGIGLFVRGILFIAETQGVSALVDLSSFSVLSAAMAHYVTFAHLFGGLMLAAGLLTRLAALVQIPILVGAVFLVHLQEGLLSANQSLEFSALVLFLLVVVFVFGPGRWAADPYVFGEEAEEEPEMWWRDEAFDTRASAGERPASSASDPEAAVRERAEARADLGTCPCGHDLMHPRVTVQPRYGWSSGFFFMLGISAPVKEIAFYCEECGTVLKQSRDPELLQKYRWHTS